MQRCGSLAFVFFVVEDEDEVVGWLVGWLVEMLVNFNKGKKK